MNGFIILNGNCQENENKRVFIAMDQISYIREQANGCFVMLKNDDEFGIDVTDSFDEIIDRLEALVLDPRV